MTTVSFTGCKNTEVLQNGNEESLPAIMESNDQPQASRNDENYKAGEGSSIPIPISESHDISMYEEIFKPAAQGGLSLDWESFKQTLENAGYLYIEDEGMFSADDPANPGSYLYGILTNVNDYVEISELGYCFIKGDEGRTVEAYVLDGNFKYYIISSSPTDKKEVADYESLESYLFGENTP